jgi:hypothetical protein
MRDPDDPFNVGPGGTMRTFTVGSSHRDHAFRVEAFRADDDRPLVAGGTGQHTDERGTPNDDKPLHRLRMAGGEVGVGRRIVASRCACSCRVEPVWSRRRRRALSRQLTNGAATNGVFSHMPKVVFGRRERSAEHRLLRTLPDRHGRRPCGPAQLSAVTRFAPLKSVGGFA